MKQHDLAPKAEGRLSVGVYIESCLAGDYASRNERLWDLYERGKLAQWNAATDIDWTPEVRFGSRSDRATTYSIAGFANASEVPVPPELWDTFRWEFQAWMISQFLHGEQGALVTTARLVELVPDIAAKSYAASQVGDEARHVEAYSRYLNTKLGTQYPINPGLESLLETLLAESRWDMVYLGMQIIVEGLALAAARVAAAGFGDPVIRSITKMIARDEARHLSFGLIALDGLYDNMSSADLAEREDFICEAILLTVKRFLLTEIWERLGVDAERGTSFARTSPLMINFRQTMFHKVVQALRRLRLLTPRVHTVLAADALIPFTRTEAASFRPTK